MPDVSPPVPVRFRWLPVLGWGLVVASAAAGGWSGWRAYDYRAAVREARALGFTFAESPTPFDAIRTDWHAAFRLARWTEHKHSLNLSYGTELASVRPVLLRLDPTDLSAWQSLNVDALRGLTRLRVLDVSYSDLKDLAPLTSLTQLQTLILSICAGLSAEAVAAFQKGHPQIHMETIDVLR